MHPLFHFQEPACVVFDSVFWHHRMVIHEANEKKNNNGGDDDRWVCRFKAPVFVGDAVTARVEVERIWRVTAIE